MILLFDVKVSDMLTASIHKSKINKVTNLFVCPSTALDKVLRLTPKQTHMSRIHMTLVEEVTNYDDARISSQITKTS
jgi:hypothetical protein